jgi:Type IX secretion system protein PorV
MKNLVLPTLFCLAFALVNTNLFAQGPLARCVNGFNPVTGERCANAVTSAVPFLRIVSDARGGGMGDVGIATSADANSLHYNPSKLAFAEKKVSISATYTPWMRSLGLQDVYMAYLSGYSRIDDLQTFGGSIRYFSLGDIEFTDENGGPLGQGRPNEFEIMGAYSRELSDNLSVGAGAKFIYSNLATGQVVQGAQIRPGVSGAADLSMTYRTEIASAGKDNELTFALAMSNIGAKISYTNSNVRDFLPTNLGLGAAWKFNLDDYNSLTIATDLNKLMVPTPRPEINVSGSPNVADYRELSAVRGILRSFGDAPGGFREELNEINVGLGAEYWYDDQFAIRAGYFYEHFSKGNRKYFNVGIGVKYNVFGINFSYLVPTTNQRNPLDNTLRFSLLFDFEAFSDEE